LILVKVWRGRLTRLIGIGLISYRRGGR